MIMDNTHFIAFPGSNSSPIFNPTDKGAPAKFSSGVRRLVELGSMMMAKLKQR